MERFDRWSYFEAKFAAGCPDRVPGQFIRAELIFKIIHDLYHILMFLFVDNIARIQERQ